MKIRSIAAAAAFVGTTVLAGGVNALPVNGTGNVTPDVIFGTGNDNGSFTGTNADGLELGLRAKLRYDAAGNPQNIFNYDGVDTYTFDASTSLIPAGRSVFNFEFSINSNVDGNIMRPLDSLEYLLQIDLDPGAGTTFLSFDPVAVLLDNAIGNNTTGNGGGTVGGDTSTNPVAQNSLNLGFYTLSPSLPGEYQFRLLAGLPGTPLASTQINVIVTDGTAVPIFSTLPLLASGLALLAFSGARRRRA
ncbi:MAG: PEP-CTERM sorting domain-containing protein [Halioglobus sp.]|nr:PEP-CTERM sorting domain-containing protein [Halioglobus sp.]